MALNPGDIAIIGVNTDNPDEVTFVALVDIPQTEIIRFTDNGIRQDGTQRENEGIVDYTPPAGGLSAGDVVQIIADGTTPSASTGSAAISDNGFSLDGGGDQVIAFQGTTADPTYIFAVQTNSTQFQTTADNRNNSALPPGLEEGRTAVAVGAGSGEDDEFDNSTYGESTTSGTQEELLAAIATASNWTGSNPRIDPLADGPFTVTSARETIASQDFDGGADGLDADASFDPATDNIDGGGGDFFGVGSLGNWPQGAGVPFGIADDSVAGVSGGNVFSGDVEGVFGQNSDFANDFFGISDTRSGGDFDGDPVTATWTFDISGFEDLHLAIDMGGISDGDDFGGFGDQTVTFTYSIDGGAESTAFSLASTTDTGDFAFRPMDSGTQTPVGGVLEVTGDNAVTKLLAEDGSEADNTFLDKSPAAGDGAGTLDTFLTELTGAGQVLELTVTADFEFEAMVFDNIEISGSAGGEGNPTDLVISEIMFNPASAEDDWEWVELFNNGENSVDLTGFVLDDNNGADIGDEPNIAGGVVPGGGTAILYNADDVSAADFEAAWGTGINLVPVTNWSALALNNGGDTVGLWESYADYVDDNTSQNNALISVTYGDLDDGNGSIFLTDLGDQNSFALSTDGADSPAGGAAYTSAAQGGNSGADVGSPGGTLTQSEVTQATIMEIQGAGHVSPFVLGDGETVADFFTALPANSFTVTGSQVRTSGIVTAIDSNGFFLQDPTGDDDDATSDAIFVFDTLQNVSGDDIEIGDQVEVIGTVTEFFPGDTDTRNLPLTQLGAVQSVTEIASGQSTPTPIIIGSNGRTPPAENIDDDAFSTFEPATDGIDFFESLEYMLVTAEDLVAVAGTTRFGEIFAVTDGGTGASGLSDRGTLNISPDDFNPEKIQVDEDSGVFNFDFPDVDAGDGLGDVTGVVTYDFGNFQIVPTVDFTSNIEDAGLTPDATQIVGNSQALTIATYNVLNLDPNESDGDTDIADGRFDAIAGQIVNNLNTPDIIALQEIQDNSGEDTDGTTAADVTLQTLVDAIVAAGGPQYEFIDTPGIPAEFVDVDDLDGDGRTDDFVSPVGGVPGGNIRTAYLYNPNRVDLVDESVETLLDEDGDAFPFFGGRIPLVAEFEFNGESITVVNNHFSSKGGSAPILGIEQPFDARQETETLFEYDNLNPDDDPSETTNGSLVERLDQSGAVQDFVNGLDSGSNVVVLGDLNEFEFISPVTQLETNAGLNNLTDLLDEDERYTFNFQGNSQSLDHILVSDSLLTDAQVDNVHVNSEFADDGQRASDHDPIVAALRFDLVDEPTNTGDKFTLFSKTNGGDNTGLLGDDTGFNRFAFDGDQFEISGVLFGRLEFVSFENVTDFFKEVAAVFGAQPPIDDGKIDDVALAQSDGVATFDTIDNEVQVSGGFVTEQFDFVFDDSSDAANFADFSDQLFKEIAENGAIALDPDRFFVEFTEDSEEFTVSFDEDGGEFLLESTADEPQSFDNLDDLIDEIGMILGGDKRFFGGDIDEAAVAAGDADITVLSTGFSSARIVGLDISGRSTWDFDSNEEAEAFVDVVDEILVEAGGIGTLPSGDAYF